MGFKGPLRGRVRGRVRGSYKDTLRVQGLGVWGCCKGSRAVSSWGTMKVTNKLLRESHERATREKERERERVADEKGLRAFPANAMYVYADIQAQLGPCIVVYTIITACRHILHKILQVSVYRDARTLQPYVLSLCMCTQLLHQCMDLWTSIPTMLLLL